MAIVDVTGIMNPLISFNTIIDPDISMIHYAILDYPDSDSLGFKDVLKQEGSYYDLVYKVYHRKEANPLYYLLNPKVTKPELDKLYKYLSEEKEKDILDKYAVGTDIYNLILEFCKEGDIFPNILVYSDNQKAYIKDEENLQDIDCVTVDQIKANKMSFSQYYFKDVKELDPFKDRIENSTIYFSTSDINLNEKGEDIVLDNEIIDVLIYKNNKFCLFDMYNADAIGGYDEPDDDEL